MRLLDGSSVTIRPATVRDEAALRGFLSGLCLEAKRLRFFTGAANIDFAAHLAASTGADRYGLMALDSSGTVVGHAVYFRQDPGRAEVAVEVADRRQGCGLGTLLLQRLAIVAEHRGITTFTAEVLPDNRAMLDVFHNGFDARITLSDGVEAVEFPTAVARWSPPDTARRGVRHRVGSDPSVGARGLPGRRDSRRDDLGELDRVDELPEAR